MSSTPMSTRSTTSRRGVRLRAISSNCARARERQAAGVSARESGTSSHGSGTSRRMRARPGAARQGAHRRNTAHPRARSHRGSGGAHAPSGSRGGTRASYERTHAKRPLLIAPSASFSPLVQAARAPGGMMAARMRGAPPKRAQASDAAAAAAREGGSRCAVHSVHRPGCETENNSLNVTGTQS
jgi:hypothetical protein